MEHHPQDENVTCQRCQKKAATVHFSKVMNGEKTDRYLCEDCAREEGAFHFMLGPQFTVQHVLGGLIGQVAEHQGRGLAPEVLCPTCGYSYRRFAETGRLGCDACYEAFDAQLTPLVRRLHGHAEHHGKVPRRGGRHLVEQRTLKDLRDAMRQAVERESFEEAAQIRDQIRALEEVGRGDGHDAQV